MPVEGEVRIENPQTVKLTGVFRLGSDGTARFCIEEGNPEVFLDLEREAVKIYSHPAYEDGQVIIFDKTLSVASGSVDEYGKQNMYSINHRFKILEEKIPQGFFLEIRREGLFSLVVRNRLAD